MPEYKWDGGFAALAERDGQEIEVLRPLRVPEEVDVEVGPMFLARFPDGEEQHVYPDEIVFGVPSTPPAEGAS